MRLAVSAALTLFAAVLFLIFALKGSRFGKKRIYLMIAASALFFTAFFPAAGELFAKLDYVWPSRPFVAEISPDLESVSLAWDDTAVIALDVRNIGALTWHSETGNNPFFLSWHLLNANGNMIRFDNDRFSFPEPLAFGDSRRFAVRITPSREAMPPGQYILEFDIVQEDVTWFADRGSAACRVFMDVVR
jgi:hypothetical protein